MKRSVVFAACLWVSCLFTLSAQKTTIESKEENSLRVMSYNVRNCRGMDEVVDYQRVADIMNRVDPDVIAVQELDSASVRSWRIVLVCIILMGLRSITKEESMVLASCRRRNL